MAELPTPEPLDDVDAPVEPGAEGGRIVALVASERALGEGWAPGAAHRLAARWGGEGHRVILLDGGIDAPSLHLAAEVPNREGLVDAALYGASASRVSHQMDGGYFLITAGTTVADSLAVVSDARWHRLASGMREAGVTLLLYLRDGDLTTPAFLGSATDIIVLGSGGETPAAIRDLEPLVRAVTGPDTTPDVPAEAPVPEPEPEAAPAPEPEPALALAPKPEGGGSRVMLFVVLAVVVAALLGWFLSAGLG